MRKDTLDGLKVVTLLGCAAMFVIILIMVAACNDTDGGSQYYPRDTTHGYYDSHHHYHYYPKYGNGSKPYKAPSPKSNVKPSTPKSNGWGFGSKSGSSRRR